MVDIPPPSSNSNERVFREISVPISGIGFTARVSRDSQTGAAQILIEANARLEHVPEDYEDAPFTVPRDRIREKNIRDLLDNVHTLLAEDRIVLKFQDDIDTINSTKSLLHPRVSVTFNLKQPNEERVLVERILDRVECALDYLQETYGAQMPDNAVSRSKNTRGL